jgi:hypothetical protein
MGFGKNLRLFEEKNPRGAALLAQIESRPQKKHHAVPALESFALPRGNFLVQYGIGEGAPYLEAKKWLHADPKHQFIALEDDLAAILHFLEGDIAEDLLTNPQAHFYFVEMGKEEKYIFEEIVWAAYPEKLELRSLPEYIEAKPKAVEAIEARLFGDASDVDAVLDEYMNWGLPYAQNFWKNILLLPECYEGASLFRKFQGVPAIVCAAGPSLSDEMDLLRSMKDKALLLAGGSSLNALLAHGITPHFAGAIDPNPTQYDRLAKARSYTGPFFFRHRLLHEAAKLISGPKMYLKGGDGYNSSEYFEKTLRLRGRILGGGHSIANFLIEIASALGASPIILVGYDLAYTGGKAYAAGVDDDATFFQEEAVRTSDMEGAPIFTEWKWLLEAKWISDFHKEHKKLKIINATEGGIPIEGIPRMSLEEAARQFCRRDDIEEQVSSALEGVPRLGVSSERVLRAMGRIYSSLERSIAILGTLIEKIKKARRGCMIETPDFLLTLEKLHKEIAFTYVLDVFHRMREKFDFYRVRFFAHPLHSKKAKEQFEKELLCNHYTFLKEVAIINFLLIQKIGRQS